MQTNDPRAVALRSVAEHVKMHSGKIAWNKIHPSPEKIVQRRRAIEQQAQAIETLASRNSAPYSEFEAILQKLSELGTRPPLALISAVAKAFQRNEAKTQPPA
jgi:hypothetical protein